MTLLRRSVLSLIAVVPLLTSCRSADVMHPCPPDQPVQILVGLQDVGGTLEPTALPDEQVLLKGQRVEWVIDDSRILSIDEIVFKNSQMPVDKRPVCPGRSCTARAEQVGRFSYGIVVTTTTGKAESDPVLIIRP